MTLLENDVVFAYMNERDPHHAVAEEVFNKLRTAKIQVDISSVSLIEMELIYRSEKRENYLLKDLAAMAALPNVTYVALTPDVAVASVYLRQTLDLAFFDSHYAATALNRDRRIISFDQAYDKVPGLMRVRPDDL